MEEQSNIPQLRFPEFDGEWDKKMINDTCTIVGGGTPESGKDEFWDGNIQWFTPTEIKMDYVSKSERTITELGLKKSSARLLPKGTILLTSRATIGEVAITLNECATNQGFQSLIVNKSYNKVFIFNWIKNNRNQFLRRANGSTFLEISKSEIGTIPICAPSLPEQQKIASFFNAVDLKINQLKQKLTLLEQYKKGVMQEIFSQEIRFKDDNGQEFPKWEKKRLGELALKITEKNKKNLVTSVLTNSAVNGIVLQRDFFEKDIANQENLLSYYIVNIDDFVYNPRISSFAPVGPIKRNRICQGVMSPLYSVFKFHLGVLAFYEFYFSTTCWHKFMESIANYGARSDRMNITTTEFYEMPIPFPHVDEQTKITNFLSAIDDKICQTHNQIEKAEVWKKGLMQQMFC